MEKIHLPLLTALGALLLSSGNPTATAYGASESLEVRTSIDRPLLTTSEKEHKVVIKIEVEGEKRPHRDRIPLNLAIVLDRSGSMAGAKLEQAKQAATMLIDQLDEDDVVSLVLYDTEVQIVAHAGKLGNRKRGIQEEIRRIGTGGSTALYAGVEAGGRELEEFLSDDRINRVILLSDGIANVGPSSNREIAQLGNRLARKGGSVTTIGLGDHYNENLMTALAEASDANYYYVADVETLPEVFEKELGELKSIVAQQIEIEIYCPSGVRPLRFLGRPGELKGQRESIAFGTLSSEQTREIYLECLIEGDAIGDVSEIAGIEVRYADTASQESRSIMPAPIVVSYTEDEKLAAASRDEVVIAEAAIYSNGAETERAIAMADAGDLDGVREQLSQNIEKLEAAYAAAPVPQQSRLRDEIDLAEKAKAEIGSDQLSARGRKMLSSGAFRTRNSK